MRFFLPNFEDLVDPEYDFVTEQSSPKRSEKGRFTHDYYAHEFFNEPIFDGMLVSKAVVRRNLEKEIINAGSIHQFCRLPANIPVMGDCGAFTYIQADKPPFQVDEIIQYYQQLGFSYGVSIDHIVFPAMATAECERRVTITLDNARAFLVQHTQQACTFKPVGIIQGWDSASRRNVLEQLVGMGYQHFALGGVARSSDKEIRTALEVLFPALPKGAEFHLFGVARLSILPDFIRFGVTSADSAAPIRRAFLGTGESNFWAADGSRYAAIRVPEAKMGATKKRGVDSTEQAIAKNGGDFANLQHLEQKALKLLRAYDRGDAGIEETLEAVLIYDELHGDERDHGAAYKRTLEERPWQNCCCPICQSAKIEVIIFRGNNRNRRRGFHNAKVFYDHFHKLVEELQSTEVNIPASAPKSVTKSMSQLTLDFLIN